jgi:hypothetical protein
MAGAAHGSLARDVGQGVVDRVEPGGVIGQVSVDLV